MAQRSCCVPGCSMKLGDGLLLHRFPNPNNPAQIERFRTWVMKIGGDIIGEDNEFIHKNRKVCHKHFDDFYIFPNKKLSALAIPTLQIPGVHVGERRHIERPSTAIQMATASSSKPIPIDTDLSSRPGTPLHYFPNPVKEAAKFQNWIKSIGGGIACLDSNIVYKTQRICRRHFQDAFLYPKNRLCKLAVPTLHLPSEDVSGKIRIIINKLYLPCTFSYFL